MHRLKHPALALLLPLGALLLALPNLPGSHAAVELLPPPSGDFRDDFAPLRFEEEVAGGWVFYDLQVGGGVLQASLRKGTEKHWLTFLPPDTLRGFPGEPAGQLALAMPTAPADPTFHEAARRMADAVATSTAGRELFRTDSVPTNLPASVYAFLFLVGLGAGLFVSVPALRRAWAGRRPLLGALAFLFAGTAALRLLFALRAPLHNNHHGWEELDFLLVPPLDLYPSYYGRSHQGVVDLLFGLLPRTFDMLMAIQALVGAAAATAVWLLVRELTRREWAGWLAGLFLAGLPLAMRGAGSESPFHWTSFYVLVAAFGLVRYARRGETAALVLGHAALALAAASHILTVVFLALPVLAMVVSEPPGRTRRTLWYQGCALLTSLLLALPHVVSQWQLNLFKEPGFFELTPLVMAVFRQGNLLLHPGETPILLVLCVAAVPLLWFGPAPRRARLGAFALALLALSVPFYLVHNNLTDLVRYQLVPGALFCIVGGVGAASLLDLVRGRRATTALLALLHLALVGSLLVTDPAVARPDGEAEEFLALQEAVETLPQSGLLVLPDEIEEPFRIRAALPRFLLVESGRAYTLVTARDFLASIGDGGWPEEPVFFYRGLQYHWLRTVLKQAREEDRAQAQQALATTDDLLSRVGTEVLFNRSIAERTSPCPAYPMEFTDLPEKSVAVTLLRLSQP